MKLRLLALSCLLAVSAFAADATGKWTAQMPGRDGGNPMNITFDLKADGSTLTGNVGGARGQTDISNGKVDGDKVSFDVVREWNGNSMTMHYTGVISGDTLKLTVTTPRGSHDIEAKRGS